MRISLSLASWDYRMIRAVDGLEIRGAQTVHAQGEGKLSSMVKIVFDDVPDDPLARECIFAPTEGLIQVGEVPARQAVLDHLPGGVESTGEFGGAARGCAIVVPGQHWLEVSPALAHDVVEPPDTRGYYVGSDYAY